MSDSMPTDNWWPELLERSAMEAAQARANHDLLIENARADQRAVWMLADGSIPADVIEMAERWNMRETLLEMWRAAFIEGWRCAHRGRDLRDDG